MLEQNKQKFRSYCLNIIIFFANKKLPYQSPFCGIFLGTVNEIRTAFLTQKANRFRMIQSIKIEILGQHVYTSFDLRTGLLTVSIRYVPFVVIQ